MVYSFCLKQNSPRGGPDSGSEPFEIEPSPPPRPRGSSPPLSKATPSYEAQDRKRKTVSGARFGHLFRPRGVGEEKRRELGGRKVLGKEKPSRAAPKQNKRKLRFDQPDSGEEEEMAAEKVTGPE